MGGSRIGRAGRFVWPGLVALVLACGGDAAGPRGSALDHELRAHLRRHGFTGAVEATVEARLGRPIDRQRAELGRLLFFDRFLSLHSEPDGSYGNPCSGCHAPNAGMADTQPIAIGVDNNGMVGPSRAGPRNVRRAPSVINAAFYPRLMWDGRIASPAGDPFDNALGFRLPEPEGVTEFPPGDPTARHLLVAQAHMPVVQLPEMAGFTGTGATDMFDDGHGMPLPPPDARGHRNAAIRNALARRVGAHPGYRAWFASVFPEIAAGAPVTFRMIAQVIAEFELTLAFANAPIDRYARGELSALSPAEKRGATLFFGRAGCVECHAVSGQANEMFSDFRNHHVGVPPVSPEYGPGRGNVQFAGPDRDQDYGAEHSTGDPADRYRFRTAPLRNVGVRAAFFHNGAFTRLEDAVRHYADVRASALGYDPAAAGLPPDLRVRRPAIEPVLKELDPRLRRPLALSAQELEDLVAFLRTGLLDPRARPENLCNIIPNTLPSGMPVAVYEGCP